MRTMLLSFKPEWYEKIRSGEKIYEYRRIFASEEVIAYMYVSTPVKKVVGKIHLGKRINLNEWLYKYKDDVEVYARIQDSIQRHQYAMPIKSFTMTKEITLEELRMFNSKFVCPQMYYYLDNYPELFDFIKNHASELDEVIEHDFTYINKDDICRRKYKEV